MRIQVARTHGFSGHRDCVYALAPGPEPHQFFSAGSDGVVALWDARTGESLGGILQAQAPIYSLLYVPAHQLLLAGQQDGGLHFVDVQGRKLLRSAKAHSKAIFDLQLHPEGLMALSLSEEGRVCLWDLVQLKASLQLTLSSASLRSLAFHPQQPEFAIGGSDCQIRVYHSQRLSPIRQWQAHSISVFSLCYSRDGSLLFSGSRDAHLKSWDPHHHYSLVNDVPAHLFAINHLAYHPHIDRMASASMDKTIKLWDPLTLTLCPYKLPEWPPAPSILSGWH